MKRRQFIQNTIGLGLVTLAGENLFASSSAGMKEIIERGDILRKAPPAEGKPWLALYQGNGRLGTCAGPFGLHVSPHAKTAYSLHGATRFTHMKHHIRGRFNADYLLPAGFLYWENEPASVNAYEQHQSFYDGTIITKFSGNDFAINITCWIDNVQRDMAGYIINVKGNCPDVILEIPRQLPVMYDQQVQQVVEDELKGNIYKAVISCLNAHSVLQLRSSALMEKTENGLKIKLRQGSNEILVAINGDLSISEGQSLQQTVNAWHEVWQQTAWLDLPDDAAQKVWVRSLAYTLYSHNDDGFGCSPPTGLVGNGWPFPFPFDSACRHLLLLMTGHVAAARRWIEYYYSRFDGLKVYTKRLMKSDGIFMPHVFPYGTANDYHIPEVPNHYYYPVYNSALLVRLVDHTATMVNDSGWTKTYAVPLIREAANFYLAHLKKGNDGRWHMHIVPSISLDESGSTNKPDYLSGLISAQYVLQTAVGYGLDKSGVMQTILRDGFAFAPLLAENGLYLNHPGLTSSSFSKQKHPDQLFALVHTPLGDKIDPAHQKAHTLRYDITIEASKPRFLGHTLGEFILASTRMHDAEAWKKDWSNILPAKYADPELIQFYESTGNTLAFYVTTHGLFAQSLLENIVSTWWQRLDLCACIPWQGKIRFGNIPTLAGVTVSGEFENGRGKATLAAWKNASFNYEKQAINMKKGDRKIVAIQRRITR